MEPVPAPRTADSAPASDPVFGRILVGVDDTPESVVAAAQARTLAPAGAHLAIVAVAETAFAAWGGSAATFATGGVEHETEDLLEQASELADIIVTDATAPWTHGPTFLSGWPAVDATSKRGSSTRARCSRR